MREWQVFASIEPIGNARADINFARIAYLIAATAPRRRGVRPPKFQKFLVDWWRAERRQTPDAMLRFAASLTTAMGGTVAPTVAEALSNADGTGEDDGITGPRPERVPGRVGGRRA